MTFINPCAPIDSYTLFHWDFASGGSSFANQGSVANAAMTLGGTASVQSDGVYNNSILLPSAGSGRAMTPAGVRGGATSLTISVWYKPTTFTTYGEIFCKEYRDSGWSSPWTTFNIATNTDNTGGVFVELIGTGGGVDAHIPSGYLRAGLWSLITVTWNMDTGSLRSFVDGVQRAAGTGTAAPPDWGPVGEGRIFVGSTPNNVVQLLDGAIAMARIDNVVRSDAYILNSYYAGLYNMYKRLRV